ncbi:MAG TPA: hypothetical protein VH855_17850 [Acetobacteraceae bacterium]
MQRPPEFCVFRNHCIGRGLRRRCPALKIRDCRHQFRDAMAPQAGGVPDDGIRYRLVPLPARRGKIGHRRLGIWRQRRVRGVDERPEGKYRDAAWQDYQTVPDPGIYQKAFDDLDRVADEICVMECHQRIFGDKRQYGDEIGEGCDIGVLGIDEHQLWADRKARPVNRGNVGLDGREFTEFVRADMPREFIDHTRGRIAGIVKIDTAFVGLRFGARIDRYSQAAVRIE